MYFYCIGRAKHRTCTQPAVLIADVEASVADYWTRIQLSEDRIAQIREQVMAELTRRQSTHRIELERQEKRKRQLHDQQLKLMEARYANAIPLDLLKSEQERITRDLAGAQQIINRCSTEIHAVLAVVEEVLLLCANAHRLYLSAHQTSADNSTKPFSPASGSSTIKFTAWTSPNRSHSSSLPTSPSHSKPTAMSRRTPLLTSRRTQRIPAPTQVGPSDAPARHAAVLHPHRAPPL